MAGGESLDAGSDAYLPAAARRGQPSARRSVGRHSHETESVEVIVDVAPEYGPREGTRIAAREYYLISGGHKRG